MSVAARIHEAIVAENIPLLTVRQSGNTVQLVFADEATPQQRVQAQAIVDGFDKRERRPRSYADLLAFINGLSATDRNRLLALSIARMLREEPDIARRILGMDLDGDEV